jgi:hypothetical protein
VVHFKEKFILEINFIRKVTRDNNDRKMNNNNLYCNQPTIIQITG